MEDVRRKLICCCLEQTFSWIHNPTSAGLVPMEDIVLWSVNKPEWSAKHLCVTEIITNHNIDVVRFK
jgi:hypothetical protein